MADESMSHVFEHSEGDWWVECLICGEWVCTSNDTERTAHTRFGRHLQNDHPERLAERRAR